MTLFGRKRANACVAFALTLALCAPSTGAFAHEGLTSAGTNGLTAAIGAPATLGIEGPTPLGPTAKHGGNVSGDSIIVVLDQTPRQASGSLTAQSDSDVLDELTDSVKAESVEMLCESAGDADGAIALVELDSGTSLEDALAQGAN